MAREEGDPEMEGHTSAWLTRGFLFISFYQQDTYTLEKQGFAPPPTHSIHTLDKQTVLLQALINSFVYSEKD